MHFALLSTSSGVASFLAANTDAAWPLAVRLKAGVRPRSFLLVEEVGDCRSELKVRRR
jgi:hypothetical protein